jgi:transposase
MMNLHLAAISADVAPGCHALLLADQAGWHLSRKLVVPHNITIVPLPPKCPELNPQENVWQFVRDNWLASTDVVEIWRVTRCGVAVSAAVAIGPVG